MLRHAWGLGLAAGVVMELLYKGYWDAADGRFLTI